MCKLCAVSNFDREQCKDNEAMWKEMCRTKISFMAFATNDLALFYKNELGFYQAFHSNNPHRCGSSIRFCLP